MHGPSVGQAHDSANPQGHGHADDGFRPVLLPVPFEEVRTSKRLRLVHATMMIRHGARTPLHKLDDIAWDCSSSRVLHALEYGGMTPHALFDIKPILFASDLAGTCYPGQLTRLGFDQHVRLGGMLRTRYVDQLGLLPSSYSPGSLYVRSSQYDRTIASAQALLAGLYPSRSETIAINVRHPSHENLFPREDGHCPALVALYKRISGPFKRYVQRLQAQELVTTLDTLALHGHLPPPGAPPSGEIHRQAARDHAALFGDRDFAQLGIGNFLGELWSGLARPEVPLRLYSAHDTSLLPLLGLIQQIPHHGLEHPPLASSLVFEVYEEVPQQGEREGSLQRHVAVWYNSRPLALRGVPDSVGPGFHQIQDVAALIEPLILSDEQLKHKCNAKA